MQLLRETGVQFSGGSCGQLSSPAMQRFDETHPVNSPETKANTPPAWLQYGALNRVKDKAGEIDFTDCIQTPTI